MRPFALVAILAALVGCSKPYEGKTFGAIEKPRHMAAGEEHVVADHEGETGSTPNGASDISVVEPGAQPGQPIATASAFPISAQPTGRPPVGETEGR